MSDEKAAFEFLSSSSLFIPTYMPASAWIEHAAFASWLVEKVKPRNFVELGVYNGYSYFSICQTAERLGIYTSCYGVDTWQGDEHAGFYDTAVLQSVHIENEKYKSFSTLMQMNFSEALDYFPDGSVDLLHIDGRHFFDDVKDDFDTWLPKMSEQGIVLLHDTNVRERDFGVWRFFETLAERFKTFNFHHGHGLGVVAIGAIPSQIGALFDVPQETVNLIRLVYGRLGEHLRIRQELADSRLAQSKSDQEADVRAAEIKAAEIKAAEIKVAEIKVAERLEQERKIETLKYATEAEKLVRERQTFQHYAIISAQAADRLAQRCSALTALLARSQLPTPSADFPRFLKRRFIGKTSEEYRLLEANYKKISRCALFDIDWYVACNEVVAKNNEDPIHHFLKYSNEFELSPGPNFDVPAYLRENPDVKRSGINPLIHYLDQGASSGRDLGLAVLADWPPPPRHLHSAELAFAEERNVNQQHINMPDLLSLRTHTTAKRVAVVIHIYYGEIAEELFDCCETISEPYDLFISLVRGQSDFMEEDLLQRFPHASVFIFENRGRDVLPFMAFAATGIFFKYQFICKLHTKRSLHRVDGEAWRKSLVAGVLPSVEGTAELLNALQSEPDLGLIVADSQVFEGLQHWLSNTDHASRLVPLLGYDMDTAMRVPFAGGSIFWIRSFLLHDLVGLGIEPEAYEPEPLPVDGALAHTVERLFSLSCAAAGMRIAGTSSIIDKSAAPKSQ